MKSQGNKQPLLQNWEPTGKSRWGDNILSIRDANTPRPPSGCYRPQDTVGWDVTIDLWQSKIQEESEKASWSFTSAHLVLDHLKEAKLQSSEHMMDTQLAVPEHTCRGRERVGSAVECSGHLPLEEKVALPGWERGDSEAARVHVMRNKKERLWAVLQF